MSRRYAVLVVEGPSDQAVVARALKLLGFKSFGGQHAELARLWRSQNELVPTYPPRSGNLYERLPMPSILYTETSSVAVYSGGGSRLAVQVRELLSNHDLHEALDAFGVVADADDHPPAAVATRYQTAFQGLFPAFPALPGEVVPGPPALGVFVLPDNVQQGVVEHLVIECGGHVYPTHMERARRYVGEFAEEDRAHAKWAPFDEQKAVVASVASLLKPGKTNTASLADNLWIGDQTQHLSKLAGLLRFLRALVPAAVGDELGT
ncbi:MAG: DUF3226 domain-containing protein [Minicystis sp.]